MSILRAAAAARRLNAISSSPRGHSGYTSAIRLSVRITISALAAYFLAQVLTVPLRGLWAVLTAVVVMQASVGGSIRASFEYVVGTFAGAVYATLVSLLVPHAGPPATGAVLALSIAPLAFAAARSATFRIAPFTAVIVLLLAGEFGEGSTAAAMARLLEVAMGGAVAVTVSLLIFPEHAYGRGRQAAVIALERLAHAMPLLLRGSSAELDPTEVQRIQDDLGAALSLFDTTVAEAKHEQALAHAARLGAGSLSRTLLRLRHDLVIIGRTAAAPLPDALARRLAPLIAAAGSTVSAYLSASAQALGARRSPPGLADVAAAMDAYAAAVAALRAEGLTRTLSTHEAEHFFALSFALDQMRGNLVDLARCVRDWMAA
jgi:uncharacterized membrane protein YccC